MRTIRTRDGKLWVFSESAGGYVRAEDSELSFEDLGDLLNDLIKKKIGEKKDLTYSVAFAEVQRENPQLSVKYLNELRKKR